MPPHQVTSVQVTGDRVTLSRTLTFSYALMMWPLLIGSGPVNIFLIPYYSQGLGLPLATVGLVMVYGRLFDMLSDVGVAYLSDRTRSRWGRRRPWILAGVPLFIGSVWLIALPGSTVTVVRLACTLLLFHLSFTMIQIPYMTQGSEISRHSAGRNALNFSQGAMVLVSILSAVLIPFLLLDHRTQPLRMLAGHVVQSIVGMGRLAAWLTVPAQTGVANYGRSMVLLATLSSITFPFVMVLYFLNVPDRSSIKYQHHHAPGSLLAAFRNPVLYRFATGHLLIQTALFVYQSMVVFYLAFVLKLPDMLLLMIVIESIVSIAVLPAWAIIANKIGRPRTLWCAALIRASGYACLWLVPPGKQSALIAVSVFIASSSQTLQQLPYLVAGDAADFSAWRTKTESRAVHVGLISFLTKVAWVLGTLSVSVAGLLGFDPTQTAIAPATVLMVKAVTLILPAVLMSFGALLVVTFPITGKRQEALRIRLERRATLQGASSRPQTVRIPPAVIPRHAEVQSRDGRVCGPGSPLSRG